MIENNNNANQNNIAIPWYKRTVNFNLMEQAAISNVKFNIRIPKPETKPQEQEQKQEQEQQQEETETETQTETQKNPYPYNFPIPVPLPERKPQEKGMPVTAAEPDWKTAWNSALKIGEGLWDKMSTQQKSDFLVFAITGMYPKPNLTKLHKGIDFAINYDYLHFNMGEYYNGLVLECGVVLAVIIIIVAAIAIPGVPPF